ncbi:hypothetical protein [Cellulomonas sp. WB94]|uniref:hypothetical protein n=1 Tax=Cellulomonas sp. WB94 TaxID=2173174 RepID=UPI0011B2906C|nr:hypothetical protein [Cellulomonas sp. WB94]
MDEGSGLLGLRLAQAIADVQHDPAWTSTTPDDQLAEVLRRLGEDAPAALDDARAALVADMEARLRVWIDNADAEPPGA